MTKTLNQIIFFFLHQNQNIFFSNIGNQNIFLEKNITPPPIQVKWSFPYKCSLIHDCRYYRIKRFFACVNGENTHKLCKVCECISTAYTCMNS